nr:AbrB/MazE/SpoVT family DNA-binding domain-containing protein [uncultured Mobiluncus sp.]
MRRKLGVKDGDKVLFLDDGQRVVMVNVSVQALIRAQADFAGVADRLGVKTEQEVVDMVKEVRRERAAERATTVPRNDHLRDG